jgi:molecular chaperone IbpA
MRTFDLTPLYRSAIGFDRLVNMLEQRAEAAPSYPPYNVELVSEDKYRIVMALAGFSRNEIEIVSERDTLHVTGRKQKDEVQRHYLHRGIAQRDFEQRFQLDNGILTIELVREVPEALKPRKIAIADANGNTDNVQVLEQPQPQQQAA